MAIFLACLFATLMLVLAVKMTAEQHQAICNVINTLAVIAMVAVVSIYFGVCLSRCWDICCDYLSTGVVGAMVIPARLRRGLSECSYGLSETSHGHSPISRRVYKGRLSKVRRAIDSIEIRSGLKDVVPTEITHEWDDYNDDYAISLCVRESEECDTWDTWEMENAVWERLNESQAIRRLDEMFALNKQIECDTLWHHHEIGGCQ